MIGTWYALRKIGTGLIALNLKGETQRWLLGMNIGRMLDTVVQNLFCGQNPQI